MPEISQAPAVVQLIEKVLNYWPWLESGQEKTIRHPKSVSANWRSQPIKAK
jgi:hypothetical protein